jgi:uncharacterized protein YjiS (DUF1127 family)
MANTLNHHLDNDCCREPPASSAVLQDLDHTIRGLVWRFSLMLQKKRQRQALLDLNDHLLDDIGITREVAEREAAQSFWA